MSFIEMKDIVKVYGKLTILHKVNMSLEKGKSSPSSGHPVPARVLSSAA